jgi:hypothetical protein
VALRIPEHEGYEAVMVRSLVAGLAEHNKLDATSLKRILDSLRAHTLSGMFSNDGCSFVLMSLLSSFK